MKGRGRVRSKDFKIIYPKARVLRSLLRKNGGADPEELIQAHHLKRKQKYYQLAKQSEFAYEKSEKFLMKKSEWKEF